MPPGFGFWSRISTAWPRRASCHAHDSPAGPAPTISTRLPDGAATGTVQALSLAKSPRKRSTAWIAMGASSAARLQLDSQGW